MNRSVFLFALVEIFSAVVIGVFILSLTYKLVQWIGRKYHGIEEYNLSYSIYVSAIILCVGIMISGILQPLISSFRLLHSGDGSISLAFRYFGTGLLYIAVAYFCTLLIATISVFLYDRLTPIREFEEIKKDNLGVALVIGSILITLTLLTKNGVILLIESLVPYPNLPPI